MQIFFSSFLLSILGLRRRSQCATTTSPAAAPSVAEPLVAVDAAPGAVSRRREGPPTLLAAARRRGILRRCGDGEPWSSYVAYGVLEDGSPVLCLSRLLEHGATSARTRGRRCSSCPRAEARALARRALTARGDLARAHRAMRSCWTYSPRGRTSHERHELRRDSEGLTLTLIADFDGVPVEQVWELWADPRQLERWWGPPTYPATMEQHDLTPGTRSPVT